MIDSTIGPQVDTEQAISRIDLQFHSESLLGGDPPAADPNPEPNPAPAEPPKSEPAPADPPKQTDPEPKPGEPPADPNKPKEDPKPEGPPENYEFKLPDGVQLDTALVEKATPIFKELNLTQEQAQKIVSLQAESIRASMTEWQKTTDGWREQTLKEHGSNWEKEKVFGAKFRDQFIDKETAAFMDQMGLFNHPGIVKMMINAGHAIAEDHFEEGSKTHVKSDKEILEEHYAKSYGKK